MSDITTTARPYAKAVFEQALAENKLALWSEYLRNLAQASLLPQTVEFISNPASTQEQHLELFQSVCPTRAVKDKALDNLIALLAANKRLMVLPAIYELYEAHKANQEKTLIVNVISFSKVSSAQEHQMIESLSQRLKRKVSLEISIDPSLLGGAIIQAGDLVIDGSVRGKLNKLGAGLAA